MFLSESVSACEWLRDEGFAVALLTGRSSNVPLGSSAEDAATLLHARSLCGKLGAISRRRAGGYFLEIAAHVKVQDPDIFWCWNGTKYIDRVLAHFARIRGRPFKAFEVANIPGFFVVEDGGVNAESASYARLAAGARATTAPQAFDYANWRAAYIADKDTQTGIPQAKVSGEEFGDKLRGLRRFAEATPRYWAVQADRLMGYSAKRLLPHVIGLFKGRAGAARRVVFFPQQVSSDSQLLFNADHDNASALKLLLRDLPSGAVLISNLHPAEHRLSKILGFFWLCLQDRRLAPVYGDAWRQLKRADEVVTINSTVGLEAAILGKPCRFLGRTLFSRLSADEAALKWYLGEHIVGYDQIKPPLTALLLDRIMPHAPA